MGASVNGSKTNFGLNMTWPNSRAVSGGSITSKPWQGRILCWLILTWPRYFLMRLR